MLWSHEIFLLVRDLHITVWILKKSIVENCTATERDHGVIEMSGRKVRLFVFRPKIKVSYRSIS